MSQSALQLVKPKQKREKIFLRVDKGCLVPADSYAEKRLREKKYRKGDVLGAYLSKLRSYGTHKHAHNIAILCMRNMDEFSGYADAHDVLKRLQVESGAACDEIGANLAGIWCKVRIPRSFSYYSMDEGDFFEAVKVMCRHISKQYWPELEPDQIEQMASSMTEEV